MTPEQQKEVAVILAELQRREDEYNAIADIFNPSEKQKIALDYLHDNSTHYIGYGGAAFGGKSYLMCWWLVLMCLKYPDTGYGLGRKELTTLKKTTLLTLFKIFKEISFNAGIDYNYNQQLHTITFNNGSQIFLIDTAYKPSDPLFERFGGYELTACAIDESGETKKKAIDILYTRTGRRNNGRYKIHRKMLEGFNPSKNHIYKRYYKPYRDGTLKDSYKFIPALPTDNPSPETEEYVKGILETADTITIERLINGNFDYDDDPSALCKYDVICDIFTNDHVSGGENRISADLAMKGRDRFVGGSWSGLICRVAIDMPKSSAKEIELKLKELKTIDKVGNTNIVADSDGLGAYLESYIKNIKTFHGGATATDNKTYGNLKDQCAFKLAEAVNNRSIKIICSPEQEELIKEEITICLKQDNINIDKKKIIKKDKMKELLGRSPDYMDMLLMGMYFHIVNDKPITRIQW